MLARIFTHAVYWPVAVEKMEAAKLAFVPRAS